MTSAIEQAVGEIDAYVAADGWDGPIRIFALVDSAAMLEANPELAAEIPADECPGRLLSVEQEDLPAASSLEELLAQIAWPETVDGAAISVERITMPPGTEDEIPDDPFLAEDFVANDPRREDIRMVVGVVREGDSWCTIRMRSHDEKVLSSPDLVPELIEALKTTFM